MDEDTTRPAEPSDLDLGRAFAEMWPAMLSLAYRITGSRTEAEDIVQECFLRLHRAPPEEAIRSLKAYLGTITARWGAAVKAPPAAFPCAVPTA